MNLVADVRICINFVNLSYLVHRSSFRPIRLPSRCTIEMVNDEVADEVAAEVSSGIPLLHLVTCDSFGKVMSILIYS